MIAFITLAMMVIGFLFILFLGMLVSGSSVGIIIGMPFTIITAGMLFKLVGLFFGEIRDMR